MSTQNRSILDRIGAYASTICAVHCLLTGLAMGFLAVAGLGFISHPAVEVGFLGCAVVVGVWAVLHGLKQHHSRWPAIVFIAGLASIVASHFVGHSHAGETVSSAPWGTILAVAGGLLIACFHLVNGRLQHRNCGCNAHEKTDRFGHPL